jgi:Family of unknown function (DUF6264)
VGACGDWTGKQMTDPRPQPEYGEYATPEQQAAAMGKTYVPPSAPETRVAAPEESPDKETPASPFRLSGNLIDRFVTIFQLGIGVLLLLSSDFFHLGENANVDLADLGISQRIPVAIDHYGWLLLSANIVLLLATFFWAYATLRRGRLAFYIPAVGYLAFSAVLGLAISVLR